MNCLRLKNNNHFQATAQGCRCPSFAAPSRGGIQERRGVGRAQCLLMSKDSASPSLPPPGRLQYNTPITITLCVLRMCNQRQSPRLLTAGAEPQSWRLETLLSLSVSCCFRDLCPRQSFHGPYF